MTAFPGKGAPVPGSREQDGDNYAHWDAAYVLGSLSEMDRREFDAHLEECRTCWDAVTELAGMPALLSLLDLDDIAEYDDPIAIRPPSPSRRSGPPRLRRQRETCGEREHRGVPPDRRKCSTGPDEYPFQEHPFG